MIQSRERPTAFVIAPTNHGTMIVNRFDYRETANGTYGVGFQLLNKQSFDQGEVDAVLRLLEARRKSFGDGVFAIDCGANIGVHTVEWARHMHGWGEVLSIEAQERIYYALAGNISINNCFNAKAILAAVADSAAEIDIPKPDYFQASSFASMELIKNEGNEYIGQELSYSEDKTSKIKTMTIDSLELKRVDLIKLDVEGMEESALLGAMNTIETHKPILVVEHIKSDKTKLINFFKERKYKVFKFGLNFLSIHSKDPVAAKLNGDPIIG